MQIPREIYEMCIEIRRNICDNIAKSQTRMCWLQMENRAAHYWKSESTIIDIDVRTILKYKLILISVLEGKHFDGT